MDQKRYLNRVKQTEDGKNIMRDIFRAFWVGGIICTFGQALTTIFSLLGLDIKNAGSLSSVTLIFLACLFTGIGWFDTVAKYAGAGTLVPITGFANAISSPAIDCKSEGYILGVGAKMFTIAGPVIVYGTVASIVYGIVYWLLKL